MRRFLVTIVAALLSGCATNPDPIDQLVSDYTASRGMWVNGAFPILGLPQTASQEEVVKRALEKHAFSSEDAAHCKIIKIRQIYIPIPHTDPPGEHLFTALVQVKADEKIVLFRWVLSDWWTRVCDVKPSA